MMPLSYPCGCINRLDPEYGNVMRSVLKCNAHKAKSNTGREDEKGQKYYEKCGTAGLLGKIETPHVAELCEALGDDVVPYLAGGSALEVGCGVSPYATWLKSKGYSYFGTDTCGWAIDFMRAVGHDVAKIETWEVHPDLTGSYDLVLAAHVLEHIADAPNELCDMRRCLKPGGQLVLVVPDDSDPVNPDHLWFFTQKTLRVCMLYAHFTEIRTVERQIMEHEKFIYAAGTAP